MHSRLFQVSEQPISEEDYAEEYTFYDDSNFVPEIGDYIVSSTDETDDLNWLKDYLSTFGGIEVDAEHKTISIIDKKKYFSSKYDRLMELLDKAKEMTLEQYCFDAKVEGVRDYTLWEVRYDLEKLLNGDRFGFYLYSDDRGYDTFDEFVRGFDNGTVLYVGAIFDYHS